MSSRHVFFVVVGLALAWAIPSLLPLGPQSSGMRAPSHRDLEAWEAGVRAGRWPWNPSPIARWILRASIFLTVAAFGFPEYWPI